MNTNFNETSGFLFMKSNENLINIVACLSIYYFYYYYYHYYYYYYHYHYCYYYFYHYYYYYYNYIFVFPSLNNLALSLRKQAYAIYCNISQLHVSKTIIFRLKNCDILLVFAKNIDRGVPKSTHDLCFRANIRKNEHPCKPHFTI